jgi:hypothetical protein
MTCDVDMLNQLRVAYPTWDFTVAGGQWIATRGCVLTEVEMSRGLVHVLTMDTIGQLRYALAAQHAIETGSSTETA